ncbi:hypothetical protein A2160_03220 [Candidatus Beckwithbacteria bacterium RBG_13_42_9]|uniref:Four helix bundle protein n=1 Tax=Candidatus Beckwithbacteria bacterium RBG_13_42_9 TaxID=1797457 RepID=A0A1F5E861_9BACT|nr:MAG: hypothetical protein A2160_03220 [Candidatus Beckwithbacteria bacterium RBG_13_42_9]
MNKLQVTSDKIQVITYKKLKVWQESHKLALLIYSLTRNYPKSEIFGLISQMRRAAISVPANIVEGQARKARKEFIQFLYIAKGSLVELEYFLELSLDLRLTNKAVFESISKQRMLVGRLLEGLIRKLRS